MVELRFVSSGMRVVIKNMRVEVISIQHFPNKVSLFVRDEYGEYWGYNGNYNEEVQRW